MNMLIAFVLLFHLAISSANIAANYCQVVRAYDDFKSTLDNYLAFQDELCVGTNVHADCTSIKAEFPDATDGVYRIAPKDGGQTFQAYCDMTQHGGGWMVIQRRYVGSEDFYRTWFEYMAGFGNLTKEFWLGNEKIHRVSSQGQYELRVDLGEDSTYTKYALYNNFHVANMTMFFKLTVGGYSGTAPDKMSYHNLQRFTTWNLDLDNSVNQNCAKVHTGAWWYDNCHYSDLNVMQKGSKYTGGYWGGPYYKRTTMKIRPFQ